MYRYVKRTVLNSNVLCVCFSELEAELEAERKREDEKERKREAEREKTRRQQMEEKDRREREEIEKMSVSEDERDKLLREHTMTMEKYVKFRQVISSIAWKKPKVLEI